MATTRPSFTKRQRETAKRERQQLKAAKRAARKAAGDDPSSDIESLDDFDDVVMETATES
jgi:hypothetical protein